MDRGAWWSTVHGGHKESDMTERPNHSWVIGRRVTAVVGDWRIRQYLVDGKCTALTSPSTLSGSIHIFGRHAINVLRLTHQNKVKWESSQRWGKENSISKFRNSAFMTAEGNLIRTCCLFVLILVLNLWQEERCFMRLNLCKVNGVLPFEGYANFSLGWRCRSKPDWRKPSFSSGHALVTIMGFSWVVPASQGDQRGSKTWPHMSVFLSYCGGASVHTCVQIQIKMV